MIQCTAVRERTQYTQRDDRSSSPGYRKRVIRRVRYNIRKQVIDKRGNLLSIDSRNAFTPLVAIFL